MTNSSIPSGADGGRLWPRGPQIFQQRRCHAGRHQHHDSDGTEETWGQHATGQSRLGEDEAYLAPWDHAHTDDSFIAFQAKIS